MTIQISEVFPTLSRRHRQVCALIMRGYSGKDIGRSLGISPRTVEDHKREIFARTGATNCVSLVHKALGSPEFAA